MSKENIREHWNIDALAYQKRGKLSTEYVLYGPYCPTEDDLNLLAKFSLKSDSEFTFPFQFHRKLGQKILRIFTIYKHQPC